MSETITRREWLHRTGGLAVGAGVGSLVGRSGVGPAAAQGQGKRGGVLRVATVDKPVNMDPGYAQLYSSLQVYQNVYNKLVYVDEAGQFIPGLAKSWKQEDDKTWLFDLVDNAVFHNGEPFTAKDVAFTFARILDAKNKLPMRIFFTPIEGVAAVGQYQARFHLSRSCGPLLAMLSQATEIVNEKALQEKDPKLFPIGTGPYRFVEWVKDDHITLERWRSTIVPAARTSTGSSSTRRPTIPCGSPGCRPGASTGSRRSRRSASVSWSARATSSRRPAARTSRSSSCSTRASRRWPTSVCVRRSRGRSTGRRS